MNREGIRRLAAEELGTRHLPLRFADALEELRRAIEGGIGYPCIVKPVMSSSGKGQSTVNGPGEVAAAWDYAQSGGRVRQSRVIVEEMINFDFEITQLTVRAVGAGGAVETLLRADRSPAAVDGDYVESWQPQPMIDGCAGPSARAIAGAITASLGGRGIFGVELFIKGDQVWFSEVSPRPHDTGMVTMISQDLSQFALHVRAILGLPIPNIRQHGPSASAAILIAGDTANLRFENVEQALTLPDTALRLFGKPEVRGHRRMGVALARATSVDAARDTARHMASSILEGARIS